MTDEKKIELLYDHYKDTFENQKSALQKRSLYTVYCIALIALFAFELSNAQQSLSISTLLIKKNIGNINIDFRYITCIIDFTLMYCVTTYYQLNLHINKTYKYISSIEEKLTEKMHTVEITRESKFYLEAYPLMSSLVHRLYTIVFPGLLILISIVKWFKELESQTAAGSSGSFWLDSFFLLIIVVVSVLYILNMHFNDFKRRTP